MDGLRQALAGAKVGREQALVGVENADQRHGRKVMALGQHLRADQDVGAAVARGGQVRVERPAPARAVAVHAQHPVVREQRRDVGLDALGAGAQRQQILRAAALAAGRRRSLAPAVVAHAAAGGRDAACSARRSGRTWVPSRRHGTAAPARSRGGSGTASPAGRRPVPRAPRRPARATPGRPCAGGARPAVPVAAGARCRPARADAASGTGRSGRGPGSPGTAWRCPAAPARPRCARAAPPCRGRGSESRPAACRSRRVPRRPRSGPRRGSGANTAERVPISTPAWPLRGRQPGGQALGVGKAGVQHRHGGAEARPKARLGLRREADFRHQHQRLPAGGEHRLDGRAGTPRSCRCR